MDISSSFNEALTSCQVLAISRNRFPKFPILLSKVLSISVISHIKESLSEAEFVLYASLFFNSLYLEYNTLISELDDFIANLSNMFDELAKSVLQKMVLS